MYSLPTTVEVQGQEFNIRDRGDYRTILGCFSVLEDPELTEQERLMCALIIFYDGIDTVEDLHKLPDIETAIDAMILFFNCNDDSPKNSSGHKLIDWDKDSNLICAAVNQVAGMEIRAVEYLHWFTFIGYYMSIGQSSLSTVVGIRSKIVEHKKLDKHEQEFKNKNPQYFDWNFQTAKQKSNDDLARKLWNQN